MAKRKIVHIEFPSGSSEKDAAFYRDIFEWETEVIQPFDYAMLHTGNVGAAFSPINEQVKPGDVLVYISSDDLDADAEKIKASGGKLLGEKVEIPDMGSMIIFQDPTGNTLALWKDANPED